MIQDQNGTFSAAFVCTGNICRSPMAEALARYIITKNNIGGLHFTSAGTHGYHVGERPDPRTLALLKQRGIETQGLRAKKFTVRDFEAHDVILGLDQGHVESLLALASPEYYPKIHLLMPFAQKGRVYPFDSYDVPDPYYGAAQEFEEVYKMLEWACASLLQWRADKT